MHFFKPRKRQTDKLNNSIPQSSSQNQESPRWNTDKESLEKYRRTLQKKNPNPTRHDQPTFTPNREAQRTTQSHTKDGSSSLWVALKEKDDTRCLFLIKQGARWEGTTPPVDYCQTALHLASGNNLLETCKELIKRGADVNAINALGNTPLYEAAGFGNAEVCELLLRNGAMASLELKNRDGYTPLLEAMEYNHDAAAKVLLEFGAKPNSTPNSEEQCASAQSPVQVYTKGKVKVVFRVNVPIGSNNVYIAGTFNSWNPKGNCLERVQQTDAWLITLEFPEGEVIEYKYTQGTWDSVETAVNQADRPNRRNVVKILVSDPMQINDNVEKWKRQIPSTMQSNNGAVRGGFGEPYCSPTCYIKAGEEITTRIFIVSHGVCSVCQRPTDSQSARAFFPYRGQYFYVCNGCVPAAKEFVRGIKDCCICGKRL